MWQVGLRDVHVKASPMGLCGGVAYRMDVSDYRVEGVAASADG